MIMCMMIWLLYEYDDRVNVYEYGYDDRVNVCVWV